MFVASAPRSGEKTGSVAAIKPSPMKAALETASTAIIPGQFARDKSRSTKRSSPATIITERTTAYPVAKMLTPARCVSRETGAMNVYSSVPSQRSYVIELAIS